MIETLKILTKKVDVKSETFFQLRSERGVPDLFRSKKIFKKLICTSNPPSTGDKTDIQELTIIMKKLSKVFECITANVF